MNSMIKKLIKIILYPILGFFVLNLLLEIVLGIVFTIKDRNIEPMAVKDYPYLYYLFEKGEDTNEHGFKTTHSIEKAEEKYRIILIGGSVARGKQINTSIATFLEKELNSRLNTNTIEVINAGISAFVVEQEFILTQLILQQYEPDMIIGLDGYNDLMTFKFNRMYPSEFELPPHNWKDFRVINDNRFRSKPYSRFPYFFKNTDRLKEFLLRNKFERNYNWQSISDDEIKAVKDAYWQVIDDTHDFCKAKNIQYFSFLQPVRFHLEMKQGETLTPKQQALSKIYHQLEHEVKNKDFAYTLATSFINNLQIFTDDCHVTKEGNKIIAKDISDHLLPFIQSQLLKHDI